MENDAKILEMETKIIKTGTSYAFALPKAFVDCKVLNKDQKYCLKVMRLFSNGSLQKAFLFELQ